MNIQKMIESGSNALFVVSGGDLKEFALALIAETTARPQKVEETMLSAEQACEILGISANSLWRWGRTGYLKGQKVGRRVFYRKSDIDALQGKL